MKTFFFSKKITSFCLLSIFPTFKIFCFFPKKNFIIRAEKRFLRKYTNWYAFYSKFATFVNFAVKANFFSKNPSIFLKNPNSTSNMLKFSEKKTFHVQKRWTKIVNAIGKHRVKKRQTWTIWEEDFAFISLRIWRKIINIHYLLTSLSGVPWRSQSLICHLSFL